jgi:hypothetical protein
MNPLITKKKSTPYRPAPKSRNQNDPTSGSLYTAWTAITARTRHPPKASIPARHTPIRLSLDRSILIPVQSCYSLKKSTCFGSVRVAISFRKNIAR